MKQLYKICNLYGCVPIKLHQKKKKKKRKPDGRPDWPVGHGWLTFVLKDLFPKCGFWMSSIRVTWGFDKYGSFWALPMTCWIRNSGSETQQFFFNRLFWFIAELKILCSRVKTNWYYLLPKYFLPQNSRHCTLYMGRRQMNREDA